MHTQTIAAPSLSAFARRLHQIGAFQIDTEKGFTLKLHETDPEAPRSPYYCNLRIPQSEGKSGPLTFGDVETIARFFYVLITKSGFHFDALVGVPHAGEPFAKELADILKRIERRQVPLIELDKKTGAVLNPHLLQEGMKVLLVDDVITNAGSKLRTMKRLKQMRCVVTDCLVFLDREESGAEELITRGIQLHVITTVSQLLALYEQEKLITEAQADKIRDHLNTF